MTAAEIYEKIKNGFGEAISALHAEGLDPFVVVTQPVRLPELARFLNDDPELRFTSLMCLSGVDDGTMLGVVYNLCSMDNKHRFTLKVEGLDRENPHVPTVEKIWPTANWHEREAYDMFGIIFDEHSDLRRILCPDDWEGWPLRKDYQVQEFWHGIRVPYPTGEDPDRGRYIFRDIPEKPYPAPSRADDVDLTTN
jgi:NADH-quinone oxidoreductase subunit C